MSSGSPHESVLRELSQETMPSAWWLLKTLGWGVLPEVISLGEPSDQRILPVSPKQERVP